jgi:hypothetical protein
MWFREIAEVENPGRGELQAFVDAVMEFLGFVLEHPDEFAFLWEDAPELRELAIDTFREDVSESAAELRRVIPEIPNEALAIHGLIGRPAEFKFKVLHSVANLWDNVRNQGGRIRGWFKRTTKAIDVILDSLGGAAGGIGGVLEGI